MFARTPTGGLAFPMSIVTDPLTLTRQKIQDEFALWLGAWFLDITQGFPWVQRMLGIKNPSVAAIRALLRDTILETPRVIEVIEVAIVFDKVRRNFSAQYAARIDTGAVVAGGVTPFTPGQGI